MVIEQGIQKKLLYMMKRIRSVEENIAEHYGEWKMRCPTHLYTGQEAIAAGVCAALKTDDFVVSTHRSHGHYLAKGGSLKRMIAEIYGKATGCSSGKGGSMHLIDEAVGFMGSTSLVGGTIPVGTGLGLSIRIKAADQVSCVFFGDGAAEEGVFYESLNFAILKKLPVLYICENNLYSVYSSLDVRQPVGRKISDVARCLGINSDLGDGNDASDVYMKAKNAVNFIRSGNGPYFLEFATYRWREHCGPNFDNHLGYRREEEYLYWKSRDPIRILTDMMKKDGIIGDSEIAEIEKLITEEVREAFDFAELSPFPLPEEAYTHLFKE